MRLVICTECGYLWPGAVSPSRRKEGAVSYARQMLDTYPRDFNVDAGVLAATINALNDRAQACTACASRPPGPTKRATYRSRTATVGLGPLTRGSTLASSKTVRWWSQCCGHCLATGERLRGSCPTAQAHQRAASQTQARRMPTRRS
jgi:hypothetical protein